MELQLDDRLADETVTEVGTWSAHERISVRPANVKENER